MYHVLFLVKLRYFLLKYAKLHIVVVMLNVNNLLLGVHVEAILALLRAGQGQELVGLLALLDEGFPLRGGHWARY